MLATGTVIDLGDAVANGIALFAAVMSIIALFLANSRAKDANEIALDANRTSREARDIAKSAHQRTVEHYEHIESQELERLQAEFKELTTPHITEIHELTGRAGFNSLKPSDKLADLESIHIIAKSIHIYAMNVMEKINMDQVRQFLTISNEITEALMAYSEAHKAFLQEYEADLADVEQASVDEDHTGRLRVAKENLSTALTTYKVLLMRINYAEDYRDEMNRIPRILESIRKIVQNNESASQADSGPD